MSTTEFWNEEPSLLWTYHSLYMRKEEIEKQKIDFNAWLQGYYVCKAIATCFSKGQKYPKQPMFTEQINKNNKSNKAMIADKVRESLNRSKKILESRGRSEGKKTQ